MDDRRREFVRLLTTHERRIYGYILSFVPRWNDADEILQETNIRLWDEFEKFESGTDFNAWALRVAYYQVLTWRKSQSRSRLLFDDSLVRLISEAQEEADRGDRLSARRDALQHCLADVSPEGRDLLSKYYGEGRRMKEISQLMNRTTQSLNKALQRLRLSLKACIEKQLRQAEAIE